MGDSGDSGEVERGRAFFGVSSIWSSSSEVSGLANEGNSGVEYKGMSACSGEEVGQPSASNRAASSGSYSGLGTVCVVTREGTRSIDVTPCSAN